MKKKYAIVVEAENKQLYRLPQRFTSKKELEKTMMKPEFYEWLKRPAPKLMEQIIKGKFTIVTVAE